MSLRLLTFRVVVLVLLLAILGTGVAMLVFRALEPGRKVEIILPPEEKNGPILVYVSGAVEREGVYSIRPGDRVADAIEAAGGLRADADRGLVNLAERLRDEQHVRVPVLGAAVSMAVDVQSREARTKLNINTASKEEFEGLEGIGPVLAAAIIDYRQANGPFARVEDLLKVPRIGEGLLGRIRPFVSV